jgi:hypothetical protein
MIQHCATTLPIISSLPMADTKSTGLLVFLSLCRTDKGADRIFYHLNQSIKIDVDSFGK